MALGVLHVRRDPWYTGPKRRPVMFRRALALFATALAIAIAPLSTPRAQSGAAPPVLYSSYLGGSGVDVVTDTAVDAAGNVYVTGSTSSTDFPTLNAIQSTYGGEFDIFVAKISAAGTPVFATYLGGAARDLG